MKNNDMHETCHHDFSFQLDYASHDNYFVEFAPTIIHEIMNDGFATNTMSTT